STSTCLFTSWRRNSKERLSRRKSTLEAAPVIRLSSASTRQPFSKSAAQRWEPMNPAPPDTTARGLIAAHPPVHKAQLAHLAGLVDVAAVDQHGPSHGALYARHVQLPELVPLRHQQERVGAARDRV